ncbi:Pimeloyl-ACP methyl ester carboxylesterase [Raineyella antarctica]|uniref:Pimeloyl-ACP methyl ester carboxylesterase n=1 Tax=Raineyella antarctica TaxID=1577474 RepID=A0A1G6GFT2_9ACTN|nr:alpha/beta hydrolase [Raineyella antarctica]SDB80824.1 Pimeloyl-ACP methyl ester carboxylesterase [Raineyella antarctica]
MTLLAWHRHGTVPAEGSLAEVPLVLLHAFPFDATMWHDVVAELDDIPVLTVDAPGFGDSAPLQGEPSLVPYADAIVADLAELGVHRAVVAGLSMGGYTLLEIASRRPEVLAGLALLDTKATADDDDARAARLAAADEAEGEGGNEVVSGLLLKALSPITLANRPQVVDQVREDLGRAPAAGIAWAQRAMAARPDHLEALGLISAPAIVLRGEHDTMGTAADARQMASRLADVEMIEIPEAGHFSHVETPAAVAQAVHALYLRAVRRD